MLSLKKLVVLCVLATTAFAACSGDVEDGKDVYVQHKLPVSCNADFRNCSSNLCACVGVNFDAEKNDCGGSGTPTDNCTLISQCLSDYTTCVNHGWADLSNENTTCSDTRVSFFHTQALKAVLEPSTYNTSDLYGSCAAYVCSARNNTDCPLLDASLICSAPDSIRQDITMTPGSTPAPTNPDGSFAVPTYVVTIVLKFLADFDGVFATADGIANLKNVTSKALTKRLGYKTLAKLLQYLSTHGVTFNAERNFYTLSQGSLTTTAEAEIPTSDQATLNTFVANVNSLKSDTSTGWYSSITAACQSGGGCVGGLNPPTVSYSVGVKGTSSSTACAAGCIAGAVIGAVVGVVLITGAIIYCVTKKASGVAPDPEGKKAYTNEETKESSP